MRVEEGFAMLLVAFFGLVVGTVLGERSLINWKNDFSEWPGIFLPNISGWVQTLILEITALLALWQLAS